MYYSGEVTSCDKIIIKRLWIRSYATSPTASTSRGWHAAASSARRSVTSNEQQSSLRPTHQDSTKVCRKWRNKWCGDSWAIPRRSAHNQSSPTSARYAPNRSYADPLLLYRIHWSNQSLYLSFEVWFGAFLGYTGPLYDLHLVPLLRRIVLSQQLPQLLYAKTWFFEMLLQLLEGQILAALRLFRYQFTQELQNYRYYSLFLRYNFISLMLELFDLSLLNI